MWTGDVVDLSMQEIFRGDFVCTFLQIFIVSTLQPED